MSEPINELRSRIDALDAELLKLLNQRAQLAREIGRLKNGAVYRPEREAQVLRRLKQLNGGPLSAEVVERLFVEIISACRALEQPLTVAYLGPEGTFSEESAIKRFGSSAERMPCPSIDEVFRAVESRHAHYGVVPVENSTEGAVGRTLDLLLQTPLKVCGEIMLQVHQTLLFNGDSLAEVKRVYSHPQSFAQCQQWLASNLRHAERVTAPSNAEAARLASGEPGAAAIASRRAGSRFQLKVFVENIEDDPRNTTRFLVIGPEDAGISGNDKTSLVMSATNRPGAMRDLLEPFARRQIDLTRLESRPSRTGLWEYVFYVDIKGHREEPQVATALAEVGEKASLLKILGSYPCARD
ncbi:MAG: prephenate dehydratase [Azospira oryzae]|uniref:Bifunctional chorismate mutase/prephenate dehydratase n=1 Tax=Pelomicrobium methylotrophicum TaxID=2602750 RepID=A0A5C7EW84_9PROT|nr:prephenate dehydratase [Pelomicrobium methylotrophicum]PZP64779.1 MAG: prephenate dehydratase [Azospira oryzae]PZP82746.1 MAG: prephenate dehydratase [Azospira oryzae]TXF12442.1 prephenate dehydratase [Pelomicrobium methylotrophicum]